MLNKLANGRILFDIRLNAIQYLLRYSLRGWILQLRTIIFCFVYYTTKVTDSYRGLRFAKWDPALPKFAFWCRIGLHGGSGIPLVLVHFLMYSSAIKFLHTNKSVINGVPNQGGFEILIPCTSTLTRLKHIQVLTVDVFGCWLLKLLDAYCRRLYLKYWKSGVHNWSKVYLKLNSNCFDLKLIWSDDQRDCKCL